MKKLLIPAVGVAAAIGAAQPAAADVLLSQLMIQGQPGYTGTVNRTTVPGSAGIAPLNTPVAPSPFTVPPSPNLAQPSPFIGQRGDLNAPVPEIVTPGERDDSGRLGPTVDRSRARFAGERGPDGKLLPTYAPDQAQAPGSSQTAPQAAPPTPSRSDMPADQPSAATRRPGSGAMNQPSQPSGTTTGQTDRSMQYSQQRQTQQGQQQRQVQGDRQRSGSMGSGRGHPEEYTTSALNALSSQGYSDFGRMERVGNMYQTTAMRDGRQVTVQFDPQTGRVTER
jgi:hypothetical protein